jgi:putative mRNA 3-end processing factor
VSHAHAARALGGAPAFATPETLAIAAALGARTEEARALAWGDALELPVARELGGGTARLSLAPAGHVLGAAQLVVDHPHGRLVYTGDWGREGDATHPAGAIVECDELVVATTFALPIFRFDPLARAISSVVDWCAEQLAEQTTPIVLAQTPGPAQSLVRALVAGGLPVSAHDEVRRACVAYEALGVAQGEVREHIPGTRGTVVVAPASARATEVRGRGRTAVAYASGWALLDAAVEQRRADGAFAVADQADHDALFELVRASGARRVIATRGDARAFAHLLRGRGIDADALELSPIDERGAS